MVLWYDQPAGEVWLDGLLIGNGYMGGNVFGRTDHERIALNESTFWSGRPVDYNDPEAHNYYDQIKQLMYAKKYKEAENLVNEHFYGKPANQQTYVPVGDLLLDFPQSGEVKDYYRELDMETGVVTVRYTEGDVKMTSCEIKSHLGKPFTVRYAGRTKELTLAAGKSVKLGPDLE